MAYCGKESDEILDKETGEMVHMRSIGKHWSYLNMKRMKDFIQFRVRELGRKEFFAMRRQLFKLYRNAKRRKLISFDEDGYEYWESSKQSRWRKQKSKMKKCEQVRIAQGGYLMTFMPNEILEQLLNLFGTEVTV
jgi:phage pi2 protein 07